jgi:hypothetical protein
MKSDARVDQYIAKAPAFAQPILKEVRARVGRACPEAIETGRKGFRSRSEAPAKKKAKKG